MIMHSVNNTKRCRYRCINEREGRKINILKITTSAKLDTICDCLDLGSYLAVVNCGREDPVQDLLLHHPVVDGLGVAGGRQSGVDPHGGHHHQDQECHLHGLQHG